MRNNYTVILALGALTLTIVFLLGHVCAVYQVKYISQILTIAYLGHFRNLGHFEVVDRVSETQLHMTENLN